MHHRLPVSESKTFPRRLERPLLARGEKSPISTGQGRKLGFLPSYPEWTVLTTLTPATGQVGFLGHSSSSFSLPFQYGRVDVRSLGYAFKRAVFMRAGVRGLLVFLFLWGKAGLAYLQVESVLGQVG